VIPFPKPRPAVDLDQTASELLTTLGASRGVDTHELAADFLRRHSHLDASDIVAGAGLARKVISIFERALLNQDHGGASA
jgi:hypothetical protein